jgi:hypothetical protein
MQFDDLCYYGKRLMTELKLHLKLTAFYNCLRLCSTIYCTIFTAEKFIVTIIIITHVLLDVGFIEFSIYYCNLLEF